jgi:hypothetical protein
MTNLVTRLRAFPGGVGAEALCREAADELEQLRADISQAYDLRDQAEGRFCTALGQIERLQKREGQLIEFVRSFISGGVNQDFKPWASELYQKLYSSHEPGVGAPFPYPTDRDGWICSGCHGWNGPKTRVCLHSHVPLDPQGASRDASSGEK